MATLGRHWLRKARWKLQVRNWYALTCARSIVSGVAPRNVEGAANRPVAPPLPRLITPLTLWEMKSLMQASLTGIQHGGITRLMVQCVVYWIEMDGFVKEWS